jgi:hypothetical protein
MRLCPTNFAQSYSAVDPPSILGSFNGLWPQVHTVMQLFPAFEQLSAVHSSDHLQLLHILHRIAKPFKDMHTRYSFITINSFKHFVCFYSCFLPSWKQKLTFTWSQQIKTQLNVWGCYRKTDWARTFFSLNPGSNNMLPLFCKKGLTATLS